MWNDALTTHASKEVTWNDALTTLASKEVTWDVALTTHASEEVTWDVALTTHASEEVMWNDALTTHASKDVNNKIKQYGKKPDILHKCATYKKQQKAKVFKNNLTVYFYLIQCLIQNFLGNGTFVS